MGVCRCSDVGAGAWTAPWVNLADVLLIIIYVARMIYSHLPLVIKHKLYTHDNFVAFFLCDLYLFSQFKQYVISSVPSQRAASV